MQKDDYVTKVIFRKFKNHGDVIALFPEDATSYYDFSCYQHIGQHGMTDEGIISITELASPEEYASLFAELESHYGYNLKVYKKITPQMRAARIKNYKQLLKA